MGCCAPRGSFALATAAMSILIIACTLTKNADSNAVGCSTRVAAIGPSGDTVKVVVGDAGFGSNDDAACADCYSRLNSDIDVCEFQRCGGSECPVNSLTLPSCAVLLACGYERYSGSCPTAVVKLDCSNGSSPESEGDLPNYLWPPRGSSGSGPVAQARLARGRRAPDSTGRDGIGAAQVLGVYRSTWGTLRIMYR